MKETFCPRLWNEYYINDKGFVFSCCHNKPQAIGNIHNNSLEEIYNGPIIRKLRSQSLNGKLSCFKNCNLLSKEEIDSFNFTSDLILVSDLQRLKISFGEACNINCRMCWQNSKSKIMLNDQLLIEKINLSHFKYLDVQGGEPFFIKTCRNYLNHAFQNNISLGILTNGTIMTDQLAELLSQKNGFVKISLNAACQKTHDYINKGSKWDLVIKNIAKLKQTRDNYNSKLQIIGHMTLVLANIKELPQFIKNFKDLGFDKIDFGFNYYIPFYLKLNKKLKENLKIQIRESLAIHQNNFSIIEYHRLKKLDLVD